MNGDPGADLAAIRQLLEDHERRLYPVDRNGLPEPTRHVTVGHDMDGLQWQVGDGPSAWTVLARDKEHEEPMRCVYIHTPHSLRSPYPELHVLAEAVAMTYRQARELAAAVLAAVCHGEDELRRKRKPTS